MSYADDILVYRQGRDRETIARNLQRELDRIGEWCSNSGAFVNPSKASITWFSLNNHIINTSTPSVTFRGDVLERTSTMKYLGVMLDRSLSFKDHVDHIIEKAYKGLAAMKVMAAAQCEQRLLFLLYQGLVVAVVEYALAILTLSQTQTERLDRIQNEAMRIILGCTRDTSARAMRYLLDCPTAEQRIQMCRARDYLQITADEEHPLHPEILKVKGSRLKRGKSWMGRAEDIIQSVCRLEDVLPGAEWSRVPLDCPTAFKVIITLNRECRDWCPTVVESEVLALIGENSREGDMIIYTDGSVERHIRSAWAFTAQRWGRPSERKVVHSLRRQAA